LEDALIQQYDREELYRKVWEQPILKVAAEYGVSDVALAKSCRKLSIPVPGRGHWAKLAHGYKGATKAPLPKLATVPVILRSPVVQRRATKPDQEDADFAAISERLSSGALAPPSIDSAIRPHSLIRLTASHLRSRTRKDEFGILLQREPGGLDIKVSEGTLDRALQIMAQVIAVLEGQGFSVKVSDEGYTLALVNGEHVRFALEEPIRKVVTLKPRVPNPTDRWDYDEIVTHEPTGKIVLNILTETSRGFEQRKRWSDAKIQRVEDKIADLVAGMMQTAIQIRRDREECKRREEGQQKRAMERAQLQRDIQEEEKKLEQLNKSFECWDRADRMRCFIKAYADKSGSWPKEKQSQRSAWIEWANQQADRIDPLVTKRPASVLDRKHELNWW
jgi:hypothetical protein